ncbi:MAG: heme-binding beta-barrel domain-containing protein [Buchananella hordeovulneris]|nr:heme-binding beta-barrel domain-containing protein [Buchananella hordeovulneris]
MTLSLPDGLAPEVYPLAWLVGSWQGFGELDYPGIDSGLVIHEMTFDHDGGPYLRQTWTVWTAKQEGAQRVCGASGAVRVDVTGAQGYAELEKDTIWSTETTYWRCLPGQSVAAPEGGGAHVSAPVSALELVGADPAGHAATWRGAVQGPRIETATLEVSVAPEAAKVESMRRHYGLVNSELMVVGYLAAFGQEEQPYFSGRLARVAE